MQEVPLARGRLALLGLAGSGLATLLWLVYGLCTDHVVSGDVLVHQPPGLVFETLTDSDKATEWSVFVDTIQPLRGNGWETGSVRRFTHGSGISAVTWEEQTLMAQRPFYRHVRVYNAYLGRIIGSAAASGEFEAEESLQELVDHSTRIHVRAWGINKIARLFVFLGYRPIEQVIEQDLEALRGQLEQGVARLVPEGERHG